MGLFSIQLESYCYFHNLVKNLNLLSCCFIVVSLLNLSNCIYEDQIGKFDWHQEYVGKIKYAQFDTSSAVKKIIIATEDNVLAALNLKTGQILWRNIFENSPQGNIQHLNVGEKIITVSGENPYLVRGWNIATGVLQWEWSLTLHNGNIAEHSEWWVHKGMLVHFMPFFGSHVELTMYNLMNGQNKGSTSKLPAKWSNMRCILSPPYYTCISDDKGSEQILSLDVTSNGVQLISRPLSVYTNRTSEDVLLRKFDGNYSPMSQPGFLLDESRIILIKRKENSDVADLQMLNIELDGADVTLTTVETSSGPLLLHGWQDNGGFNLRGHLLESGREIDELSALSSSSRIYSVEFVGAICTRSPREQFVCRILLNDDDDALHMMHQGGRIVWTREESLANVVAVKFLDLPVSELDAAIESEFDQKEGSMWAAFTRRLYTQGQQLRTLMTTAYAAATVSLASSASTSTYHSERRDEPYDDTDVDADTKEQTPLLVRDYFNLHKVILVLTESGKIFGIDNMSGGILWKHYEPRLDTEGATIQLRRSARHPPHDAYVTIVGKDVVSGNGLLVSLNPINGELIGERVLSLDSRLLQVALMPQADNENLHALILLDQHEHVQVLPVSSSHLLKNMFIFVSERANARVQGFALKYDGKCVNAIKTWSLNLGGGSVESPSYRIVQVVAKDPSERVHSPGKVMGDRSVLYKYINPNLVLFISEGPDPIHKNVVLASCVDVVSGALVASQYHKRARATRHAVHSEHFIAYAYYNDKLRRTEIASMELYEGKVRWSVAGASFSSLSETRSPMMERQSYILPANLDATAHTATERSLTDKHLLMALSSGGIVELPWAYLEARRSATPSVEQREEGILPYAPELPLPAEAVLNYNRTLHRTKALHVAPSGLESTCLLLATGLDLFYTRVTPSKTFDLLKEDFDYYLITLVLGGLIVATYSTKYFASRKMLKHAWK